MKNYGQGLRSFIRRHVHSRTLLWCLLQPAKVVSSVFALEPFRTKIRANDCMALVPWHPVNNSSLKVAPCWAGLVGEPVENEHPVSLSSWIAQVMLFPLFPLRLFHVVHLQVKKERKVARLVLFMGDHRRTPKCRFNSSSRRLELFQIR